MSGGFFVRGGIDLLEAFRLIREEIPTARLVIRAKLPKNLPSRSRALLAELRVEVIDTFLSNENWERLKMEAD